MSMSYVFVYIMIDHEDNIKVDEESQNLFILATVIFEKFPIYWRTFFKKRWNKSFPDKLWKSNEESGRDLIKQIRWREDKRSEKLQELEGKIRIGDESRWDCGILINILHDCGLRMFDDIKADIREFKEIRNKFIAQSSSMKFSSEVFNGFLSSVKQIAEKLLGNKANDIDSIRSSAIGTELTSQFRDQLEKEKKLSEECEEIAQELKSK